MLNPILQ